MCVMFRELRQGIGVLDCGVVCGDLEDGGSVGQVGFVFWDQGAQPHASSTEQTILINRPQPDPNIPPKNRKKAAKTQPKKAILNNFIASIHRHRNNRPNPHNITADKQNNPLINEIKF